MKTPLSAAAGPSAGSAASGEASAAAAAVQAHEAGGSGRIGACGHCRSKKIKCSGDHPTCVVCAKHSLACVYPEHQSRRRKDKSVRVDGDPLNRRAASEGHGRTGAGTGSGSAPSTMNIGTTNGKGRDWRVDDNLGMSSTQPAHRSSTMLETIATGASGSRGGGIDDPSFDTIHLPPLNPADALSQWHFSPQNINLSSNSGGMNINGLGNDGGSGDMGMSLEQIFGSDPFFDLSFLNGPLPGVHSVPGDGAASGIGMSDNGKDIDWSALGLNMDNSPSAGMAGVSGSKRGIPSKFRVPYFR